MKSVLGDIEVEEKIPVRYHCNCSRDRVKKALISIGRKEIESMISEEKSVNLHCDFCNKDYKFTIDELKEILKML